MRGGWEEHQNKSLKNILYRQMSGHTTDTMPSATYLSPTWQKPCRKNSALSLSAYEKKRILASHIGATIMHSFCYRISKLWVFLQNEIRVGCFITFTRSPAGGWWMMQLFLIKSFWFCFCSTAKHSRVMFGILSSNRAMCLIIASKNSNRCSIIFSACQEEWSKIPDYFEVNCVLRMF